MTPAQPDPARWDIGNHLLAPGPIVLTTTLATSPADGASEIIATVRTTTGTLTGTLDRAAAEEWVRVLQVKLAKMPRIILARPGHTAPPNLAPPNGHHP